MRKIKKRLFQIVIIIQYVLCLFVSFLVSKKYNKVWLISERGDEARDNGYAFYSYLKKHHKNIHVKYVITKNSADISKIDKSDIIIYKSIRHMIYFINSKYLISTHIMGFSPDSGLFSKLDKINLIYLKGKKIFLQHGVIYNYLPQIIGQKIDLFISSSEQERNFIIQKHGFNEEQVICTGLARYDFLVNKTKKYILVMPTWRAYLYYDSINSFQKSMYFNKWNDFLKDTRLQTFLKKHNIKLYFYPHYEIQRFCDAFKNDNPNIVIANNNEYDIATLLRECQIFITDYSSTYFDIAYLKKPIIFYQFDYKDFYTQHYREGYIKPSKNGFGQVVYNVDDLILELNKIEKNNSKIDKKFEKRIDEFFKYHDKNNCERIYNAIINLK